MPLYNCLTFLLAAFFPEYHRMLTCVSLSPLSSTIPILVRRKQTRTQARPRHASFNLLIAECCALYLNRGYRERRVLRSRDEQPRNVLDGLRHSWEATPHLRVLFNIPTCQYRAEGDILDASTTRTSDLLVWIANRPLQRYTDQDKRWILDFSGGPKTKTRPLITDQVHWWIQNFSGGTKNENAYH